METASNIYSWTTLTLAMFHVIGVSQRLFEDCMEATLKIWALYHMGNGQMQQQHIFST